MSLICITLSLTTLGMVSVAGVFRLPHESNLAQMLRDDLAATRKQWLAEVTSDAEEYAQRQQSDFLTDRPRRHARSRKGSWQMAKSISIGVGMTTEWHN